MSKSTTAPPLPPNTSCASEEGSVNMASSTLGPNSWGCLWTTWFLVAPSTVVRRKANREALVVISVPFSPTTAPERAWCISGCAETSRDCMRVLESAGPRQLPAAVCLHVLCVSSALPDVCTAYCMQPLDSPPPSLICVARVRTNEAEDSTDSRFMALGSLPTSAAVWKVSQACPLVTTTLLDEEASAVKSSPFIATASARFRRTSPSIVIAPERRFTSLALALLTFAASLALACAKSVAAVVCRRALPRSAPVPKLRRRRLPSSSTATSKSS
mmetsp:Transcript_12945/g.33281  ORF Transcript_12945/g.33281 Transcript_12945/m.33281 type:complete len:273 (-) Transcript_12945:298-1116(-)